MKRTVSVIISIVLALSVFASCSEMPRENTSTSSDYADSAWLEARIGEIPDNVTIGLSDSLGIDMSNFEDDGYIIRTENGETVLCGKTEVGLDLAVRAYAKAVKYGYDVADKSYHEGYRIEKLTVAGRDISEYTVVYTHTDEPTMPQFGITKGNGEYAAQEFVRLIKQATGVELPMTTEKVSAPFISFEAFDSYEEYSRFGGYSYEVKDGNIYFKGNADNAGCSNGVYYFLEYVCGWTGLTYGPSNLRESEHIDIPEGTARNSHLSFGRYCQGNLRNDGIKSDRNTSHIGLYHHCCHGLWNNKILGPDFNYTYDQPCYYDEEVIEESIENTKAVVQKKLDSGLILGETLTYIDLGSPDNDAWCKCKQCMKSFKENGSYSGPVLHYSNLVSEGVDEVYPGMVYLVFGYLQTKIPPKIERPNDLIRITFCMDGICNVHPINASHDECYQTNSKAQRDLGGSITNQTFVEWLEGWSEITKDISIWYYAMDGAMAQYNIVDKVMFEDVKYLMSLGIYGIYLDGECSGMGVGRLNHLMMPVLQWNPDITYEEYLKVLDEKIVQSYGGGAIDAVRSVATVFRESFLRKGCSSGWNGDSFNFSHADYSYIGEQLDGLNELLNEMIDDAPSYETEIRGLRLTLSINYEGIAGAYYDALYANDTARIEHLSDLYGIFVERTAICGYNISKYPLGIEMDRSIATTLEEEVAYWNSSDNVPKKQ